MVHLIKIKLFKSKLMSRSSTLLEQCVSEEAVKETCVLSKYETSPLEVIALKVHIENFEREEWIPVNWEIEVADEHNGWFQGIALHYAETPRRRLHILVPSSHGKPYDGEVQLDWRVVRLRNCIQQSTSALFKKVVRDSVMKVKWEVDYYNKEASSPFSCLAEKKSGDSVADAVAKSTNRVGRWEQSVARYYIGMLNLLLLVEHHDSPPSPSSGRSVPSFIAIYPHRSNLRLRYCHRFKGILAFDTLIFEEGVRSSPQAKQQILQVTYERFKDVINDGNKSPHKKPRVKSSEPSCVLCLCNPVSSVAFIPCGHQIMCHGCLEDTIKRKEKLCPLCRQVIKQRLSIYKV